ncbi:HD domain-containing phosphohydrolase [Legionella sp. km772]|uniref:HD domain-containing phosphohydrolase n=1 Tax=Legionella sp. km772 TaxID=2498111 RepID=UPI000F8ECC94|nr:HD domain-containing phosphohydrolase [Legionella sp. km772]RUR06010.1 response regulator [Legionella sp. km772]
MSSVTINANATKNILCVDDEPNILHSLQRLFLAENYTVFIADSGQEGIALLEEQAIDIVVSDMRMPHMDGAAFLKIVAERWPDTKRVLLTGFADIDSVMLAINEGKIDYYLAKPWRNESMLNAIASLLRQKWLMDENRLLQNLLSKKNEELTVLNNHLEDKVEQRTYQLHKSYQELQATHEAAIQVLLSVQELHEGQYKGYCRSVAKHAKLLAQVLKCSEKELEVVYLGAMLHNLGKSGLSESIMFKPFLKLTPEEHKEYIQYPILGATALAAFPSLNEVANAILHHRERYDGLGYPNKLAGEAIPLASRILALAVDYNELQHGLLIPEKCHAKLALRYIIERAHRYDPHLLPLFVKIIQKLPDAQSALNERAYEPFCLTPGMVLSRDLVSKNGFVYLYKGHVLTAEIIEKLNALERQIVYVYQHPPAK